MQAETACAKVLVVDPQELVQLGLRALFDRCDWIDRTFCATDPAVAVAIARQHRPHVIMLSRTLGETSSVELAHRLAEASPAARIVLLSDDAIVDRGLASMFGATAVLSKRAPAALVLDTVRRALASRLPTGPVRFVSLPSALSAREAEVLQQLARGLSNPEIAHLLHLSPHTVKQHTSALYRKLGAKNRAQAAGLARERGLVA
jgi:DNA-binding NarL/FixJ family response regulator